MKPMQRQFGKLMKKGPGDSANVSVLLSDYEDADKMLTKIIEASKAWRDAWVSILAAQLGTVTTFEELYNPIIGASDGHGGEPALTSEMQLERSLKLKEAYTDLKTELTEEVNMMDTRIIKPATEAKEYLQPIRKTIKKRENKRLDWERYTDKVNNLARKMKRTDRENATLVKSQEELAVATDEFKIADDHLRETLPPIIQASFSIIPHLLGVQILIQNTLLAQYYTILHNYCTDMGFSSPPPPMEEVVAIWGHDFKPVQQEVESINMIARGKAIHQPMALGDDPTNRKASASALTSRASSATLGARAMRIPSNTTIPTVEEPPPPSYENRPNYDTKSSYDIKEKKKPPPPPPKRMVSHFLYAEALYDFHGENQGDLSFREGDHIQVVKKTDSTDDWWEGKLNGVKGSFPANYCKII